MSNLMKKYIERNIFSSPKWQQIKVLHWKNEDYKNKKNVIWEYFRRQRKTKLDSKKNI